MPSSVKNRLLQLCEPSDFARLKPHLVPVSFDVGTELIIPHRPVVDVVFPEDGLISVVTGRAGRRVEIGVIGNEGVVGAVPVLLAGDRTPNGHVVQAAGHGFSIAVDALHAALEASRSLERLLLQFVQITLVQIAQTAYANLSHTLDRRLARWLLMCQDRLGGTELVVTHEFLAHVLGVQRSSVTVAIQTIEGHQIIRARRGRIEVLDRLGLEAVAGDQVNISLLRRSRSGM